MPSARTKPGKSLDTFMVFGTRSFHALLVQVRYVELLLEFLHQFPDFFVPYDFRLSAEGAEKQFPTPPTPLIGSEMISAGATSWFIGTSHLVCVPSRILQHAA